MIFNSTAFAIFFVLFLILYWFGARPRNRNVLVLVGSYVFYGWWDWRFLGLLAISTIADFTVASRLHRSDSLSVRRCWLWVSMAVNLGILGFFKYFNFFVDGFASMTAALGLGEPQLALRIVLPVGISFYTFQTMSYTFDVYRGRIEPCRSFITFATYVAYFPQLVAGPIERAQRLLPILENQTGREFPKGEQLGHALSLILVGLVKKVVIADGVAVIVTDVFAEPGGQSSVAVWTAILAFSIQIYGDFSGYTDIARGVSALLDIDLMVNFREPYLSRNITEFWRRWHISLSDWLRDYLYISLGGNRGGVFRTVRNLMLTMLLGGLWHGASWNFVVWGGLHGLMLVAHRVLRGGSVKGTEPALRDLPSVLATFVVVSLTWVFFRAESFGQARTVLAGAIKLRGGEVRLYDTALLLFLFWLMVVLDLVQRSSQPVGADRRPVSGCASPGPVHLIKGEAVVVRPGLSRAGEWAGTPLSDTAPMSFPACTAAAMGVPTVAITSTAQGVKPVKTRMTEYEGEPTAGLLQYTTSLRRGATTAALLALLILFSGGTPAPFLYFQF